MLRILIRIYLLVALTIVGSSFLVSEIVLRTFSTQYETHNLKRESGEIYLLEFYLDAAPAAEWRTRFDKLSQARAQSMSLITLADADSRLTPLKQEKLMRGEWVANVVPEEYFRLAHPAVAINPKSPEQVILFKGIKTIELLWLMNAVFHTLVALFLLLPLAIWSGMHWAELKALSKVADEFGAGKLSSRAAVKKKSIIYPLALCLNQMAERIERLIGAHRELLHSVSHELRTPIARLEFAMELLKKAAQDESLTPRIEAMKEDLAELNALVNELLHLAKLDQSQSCERIPFDLTSTMWQLLPTLEHAFAGKRITTHFTDDLEGFVGDRRLIERAISNLLRNAAKYAEHEVILTTKRDANEFCEIIIEDDGPGIPPEEYERIFQPFYRLDRSRDRATGGYGLGLAIALKAVQLHGGEIHVERSVLGGAKFVVVLPLSDHAAGDN